MSTDACESRTLKNIIIHSDELETRDIDINTEFLTRLSLGCVERSLSLVHSSTRDIVDSHEWLIVAFSEEYLILRIEK
jgi:hypothetical protein